MPTAPFSLGRVLTMCCLCIILTQLPRWWSYISSSPPVSSKISSSLFSSSPSSFSSSSTNSTTHLDSSSSSSSSSQCSSPPPSPSSQLSSSSQQFFNHLWKHGKAAGTDSQWEESFGTLYQFTIPNIDNEQFAFEQLRGKAVIITNVACDCGFTKSGYAHMTEWKKEFATQPFEVVAFPSNSFNQETRSAAEIKKFITEKFDVTFPVMDKSDVNGDASNPVYVWLKKSFPGDVTWNFSTYFLINAEGVPVARFEKESWDDIHAAIEHAVQRAAAPAAEAAAPVAEEKKE